MWFSGFAFCKSRIAPSNTFSVVLDDKKNSAGWVVLCLVQKMQNSYMFQKSEYFLSLLTLLNKSFIFLFELFILPTATIYIVFTSS